MLDGDIIEELAALNQLHHDVCNRDLAAIRLDFECVSFERKASNNILVLQINEDLDFCLKFAEHLGIIKWVQFVKHFFIQVGFQSLFNGSVFLSTGLRK